MQKMQIKMSSASTEKEKRGNPCPTHRYFFKSLDILDIVQNLSSMSNLTTRGDSKSPTKIAGFRVC
jgi:hypothetical protein